MVNRAQDRKEDVYAWLPRADQIAPGRVFGKGEGTAQQLMRHIDIGNKAAINNLNRLKAEDRAHIHTWTTTKNPSAVWVKGPGEDAPQPERKPNPSTERYREKKEAELQRLNSGNGATAVDSRTCTASTIEQARARPVQWWSGLGEMPAEGGA